MNLYVIVSVLDTVPTEAFPRSNWPLHLTLLGNFYTEASESELYRILANATEKIPPLLVVGERKEMFGKNADVPVTVLQKTVGLESLHSQLRHSFSSSVLRFETPDYIGAGYLPHITDTAEVKLETDEEVQLTTISLVRLTEDTAHICSTIPLS
jgi:hypothetical protein